MDERLACRCLRFCIRKIKKISVVGFGWQLWRFSGNLKKIFRRGDRLWVGPAPLDPVYLSGWGGIFGIFSGLIKPRTVACLSIEKKPRCILVPGRSLCTPRSLLVWGFEGLRGLLASLMTVLDTAPIGARRIHGRARYRKAAEQRKLEVSHKGTCVCVLVGPFPRKRVEYFLNFLPLLLSNRAQRP